MTQEKFEEHTFSEPWIANGIKQSYKEWGSLATMEKLTRANPFKSIPRIFIESPTGTGKSSFILQKLLPQIASDKMRRRKSVLYLTNRDALKLQLGNIMKTSVCGFTELQSQDDKLKSYVYQDGENKAVILLCNYQSILKMLFNGYPNSMFNIINPEIIETVIFDEVHFFLEDSLFNPFTNLVFTRLIKHYNNSAMIFMSATLDASKEWLQQTLHSLEGEYRTNTGRIIEPKYIYYKNTYTRGNYKFYLYSSYPQLYKEIISASPLEKWLIFVSSKNTGKAISSFMCQEYGIPATYLSADTKNCKTWDQIIHKGYFDHRVLATTKVLDNGVNIVDYNVRNVALPFSYKSDFIQMLGRRRIAENETINVYVEIPDKRKLLTYVKETERKINEMAALKDVRQLQKLWLGDNTSIKKLFYIDDNARLCPNNAAWYKLNGILPFYKEMLDSILDYEAYINKIKSWIPMKNIKSVTYLDSISGENFKTVDEFLEFYKEIPLIPDSVYEEFMRIYNMECYNNYTGDTLAEMLNFKKAKNIRKSTINHALERMSKPYRLIKIKKKWFFVRTELP